MLYTLCVALAEDVGYPLKPRLFSSNKAHPGKAKSDEPKSLKMLPVKRKKSISISHTKHRTTPIPTQFQQKRKNEDVRNRGDQHQEKEKI